MKKDSNPKSQSRKLLIKNRIESLPSTTYLRISAVTMEMREQGRWRRNGVGDAIFLHACMRWSERDDVRTTPDSLLELFEGFVLRGGMAQANFDFSSSSLIHSKDSVRHTNVKCEM
jgi:hypothetical protein